MVESSLLDILVKGETWLCQGEPEEAVTRYAVAAEAALKALLGRDLDSGDGLGELIGACVKARLLEADTTRALNRLNRWRIASVHFPRVLADCPTHDDAFLCRELVQRLLVDARLVDPTRMQHVRRRAQEAFAGPPREDVLLLDRAHQKHVLEMLLNPPSPVLVMTLDGETEQGHAAFSRYSLSEFRRHVPGTWREVVADWPPGGCGPSNRLARLGETLASALAPRLQVPVGDPLGDGREDWDAAFAALRRTVPSMGQRLYVRHAIRAPVPEDADLIATYLERTWAPAAADLDPGRVVLAFEIVRAEPQGFPLLGEGWRISRRERIAARRAIRTLESLRTGQGLRCRALKELESVTLDDLVEWLANYRCGSLEEARSTARTVLATSRGGRYERVVDRILATATRREP